MSVGSWAHLAVTFDSLSVAGQLHTGTKRMYIDGVLVATKLNSGYHRNTNTGLYIGSGGTSGNNFHFEGNIDEARVYNAVLSQTDIQTIMAETHPCAAGVDHYEITHAGVAITCEAEAVAVTGHDNSGPPHIAVEPGTTITITTVPATADIQLKSGTALNFTPGIGTAQYTYAAGETAVELWLRQTTAAMIDIDILDANNLIESEDPVLDFRAAVFRFYADAVVNTIGTQVAGKLSSVAPGNQALTLRAVQTNTDTGACETRLMSPPTVAVDMAFECVDPGSCVLPTGVQINGTDIAGNPVGNVTAYLPVSLDFGATGTASFDLNYADAGMIALHARLNLPEVAPDPAIELLGVSNSFVVKPAGLCVEAPEPDSDCASADTSCTKFRKAGDVFDLSVRGVAWESAGEADDAFCTGNATTENFRLDLITLAPARVAPASGGVDGVLGVTTLDITSGGEHTETGQTQSEVGVFTVEATPPTYFGEVIAAAKSANIGRFYPAYFEVTPNTPLLAPSCGSFTYQNQPFYYATAPELNVEARNTADQPTVNYRDDFFRLMTTLPRTYMDLAGQSALLMNTVPDTTVIVSGETDLDGIALLALDSASLGDEFAYQRVSIEMPFMADFDLEFTAVGLTDPDGACYDPEQDSSCNTLDVNGIDGTQELRFGRLRLTNNFGSELLPLSIPMMTEYFNGTTFVNNSEDSCTTMTLFGEISLSNPETAGGAPQPGSMTMTVASGTSTISSGDPSITSGAAELIFSAPGSGNSGFIDVTTGLSTDLPWLLFDWDGDSLFDDDATARASFGLFPGRKEIIYIREPWD